MRVVDIFRTRLYYSASKVRHGYRIKTKRKGWVAHHGIQRAGTNYLLKCMKAMDLNIINEFDPARNTPRHKHFRWYDNKETIPQYLVRQYGNSLAASSIDQLNAICKYPSDTKHVVIKKEHNDAIVSLANWGLRCGWFSSKEEAVASLNIISSDYSAYYDFWGRMQSDSPTEVVMVKFEEILADAVVLKDALSAIGINVSGLPCTFVFDEVPMSPTDRNSILSKKDLSF